MSYHLFKLLPFIFVISFQALADTSEQKLQPLIELVDNKKLYEDPAWLALLHYDSLPLIAEALPEESKIKSPEFFLAENGSRNPRAEMISTLQSFLKPVTKEPNLHARCVFPARYLWLNRQIPLENALDKTNFCEKYKKWNLEGEVKGISLIFASGYFENPASYYGHILLRFRSAEALDIDHKLLSKSLDYGAILNEDDNAVSYIFKGLFGFYDAGFTDSYFYEKHHNYGETELRDLWDYELNLSQDDVDLIVAHSWELLGTRFQYYFTSVNCATAMAELIELVTNKQLYQRNIPWVAPVSIFQNLAELEVEGKPIVKSVSMLKSRESSVVEKFEQLEEDTQLVVEETILGDGEVPSSYGKLDEENKQRSIEFLIDYYQFRAIKDKENSSFAKLRREFLIKRLKLPAKDWQWNGSQKKLPHYGQKPTMTQLSYLNVEEGVNQYEIRIRPAYFDFLTEPVGVSDYAQLGMMDLSLRLTDNDVKFHSLDFVNVETMNVSKTGLPGEGGYAWKFKTGIGPSDMACRDCSVLFVEGGYGKATKLSENVLAFALLDARLQTTYQESGKASISPRIGVITSFSELWRSQLSISKKENLSGKNDNGSYYLWENRFGHGNDWDFRLSFAHYKSLETKLSLSMYW